MKKTGFYIIKDKFFEDMPDPYLKGNKAGNCEDLASELAAVRKTAYKQYQKKLKSIINLDLVILDDFLLHPITEDDEVKALYDILEKRNELSRSCIICSQRESKAWPSMLMEDEVSSNSLLKRVTKHYNVMFERKVID